MDTGRFSKAVGKLRETYALSKDRELQEFIDSQEQVLARFQPVFSPEHIQELSEEEFRDFLLFENNRHWTGLHRQGPRICKDMEILKGALLILLDEGLPISERVDKCTRMVKGMGKAIATAILMVVYPSKY